MPCYFPLQATFTVRLDGKKNVNFSNNDWFTKGFRPDNALLLPCGKCIGCRLERSRQWALRCVHEAKLYDDNCFVTLTFNDENLPKDGNLCRSHVQKFIKRLRRFFDGKRIRVFYCGEYGDQLGRPHYHLCLFNLDFPDRKYWRSCNGYRYDTSDILSSLWPYGFSSIGDLTFESAAYVARYCTKKVSGSLAKAHYNGRTPEFAGYSLKPGIGKEWLDKFGPTDVFPHDECIARGKRCKLPRYYDKLWERNAPEEFVDVKRKRELRALSKADDNSFDRLLVKFKCQMVRFKKLIRKMEM